MKRFSIFTFVILALSACVPSHASLSAAVAVSSISCSAGTCTVTTATAHNIATSAPGFYFIAGGSLPAADVIAGTAASVPSGTTFTVNQNLSPYTGFVACASSCGTVQAAPQFIGFTIREDSVWGLEVAIVCYWNFVPNPVASPNSTSQCSNANFSLGSSLTVTQVNAALSSGAWQETAKSYTISGSDSLANIEQEWQRAWFNIQQPFNSSAPSFLQPGAVNGLVCNPGGCNE